MATRLANQTYLTLDGVRGFGAILVVLAHTSMFWPGLSKHPFAPLVDLFFVMSGFVIAFAYEPRFDRGMTARQFMLSRLVRLYPLFLLGTVMGTVVYIASYYGNDPNVSLAELVVNLIPPLFLIPWNTPGSPDIYAANLPAWTLFFELVINLLYILIYPVVRRMVGLLIVLALSMGLFVWGALHYETTDIGVRWVDFWGGFGRMSCGFFAGVLIYRLKGKPREAPTQRSFLAIPFVLAIVLYSIDMPEPWLFIRSILLVVAFGPVLAWLWTVYQPPRWIASTMALGGSISYALYILHYPIYEIVTRLVWMYPESFLVIPAAASFVVLGISLIVSYIAWRWYDEPVRAQINKWLKSRRAKARAIA
jgi:peptidoglycan/LPS O-acetylase OafA/YrhL